MRQAILKILSASLFCLAGGASIASDYPQKPIRLVVPAAPGGITDIVARLVAAKLSIEFGQSVFVENKAGGGGRIAPAEIARAQSDGYTLLYANAVGNALLPAVVKSIAYDPVKDFTPVALLFGYATTIVCHPSFPANSIQELVEYARKNPNKVTVASGGQGSGNHFSMELLDSMAKVKMLHVPYKGSGPALQDVMAGVVACTHDGAAKGAVEAGRVKALATTGLTRDPRFPSVPTLDEAGFKGYDMTWWQGVVAPVGLPGPVLDRLQKALRKVSEDPDIRAKAYQAGVNPLWGDSIEFQRVIARDMSKFKSIAVNSGITLE